MNVRLLKWDYTSNKKVMICIRNDIEKRQFNNSFVIKITIMQVPSLNIQNYELMGKGICTRAAIEQNKILMKLQKDIFITYDKLLDFQDLTWITDNSECKVTQFAFYLAFLASLDHSQHHLEGNNFFNDQFKYIQDLPTVFHNLICWSDSDLELLQNQQLQLKIKNKRSFIEGQFNNIVRGIQNQLKHHSNKERHYKIFHGVHQIQKIKFQEVLKYYSAIQSRNVFFGSIYDPGSQMGALVPILDSINHSEEPNCEVCFESDYYIVRSIREISPNEQIFVNYGNFNQQRFLQSYGFLPNINTSALNEDGSFDSYRKLLANCYRSNHSQSD